MSDPRSQPATNLFALLLSAVPHTGGPNDPTVGLVGSKPFTVEDTKVSAILEVGSGDRFRVTIDWLSDESP